MCMLWVYVVYKCDTHFCNVFFPQLSCLCRQVPSKVHKLMLTSPYHQIEILIRMTSTSKQLRQHHSWLLTDEAAAATVEQQLDYTYVRTDLQQPTAATCDDSLPGKILSPFLVLITFTVRFQIINYAGMAN